MQRQVSKAATNRQRLKIINKDNVRSTNIPNIFTTIGIGIESPIRLEVSVVSENYFFFPLGLVDINPGSVDWTHCPATGGPSSWCKAFLCTNDFHLRNHRCHASRRTIEQWIAQTKNGGHDVDKMMGTLTKHKELKQM